MNIVAVRDEVYTRILLKKSLDEFLFNDFTLFKSHVPIERLEKIASTAHNPGGRVYVCAGTPGDINALSRDNMGLREYSVMVGFQKVISDFNDVPALDTLINFVEQLEDTCRLELDDEEFCFTRLEYLKDENGTPFDFITMRSAKMFEAYFTAFYNQPVV